jgi:hypothetical protein
MKADSIIDLYGQRKVRCHEYQARGYLLRHTPKEEGFAVALDQRGQIHRGSKPHSITRLKPSTITEA